MPELYGMQLFSATPAIYLRAKQVSFLNAPTGNYFPIKSFCVVNP